MKCKGNRCLLNNVVVSPKVFLTPAPRDDNSNEAQKPGKVEDYLEGKCLLNSFHLHNKEIINNLVICLPQLR